MGLMGRLGRLGMSLRRGPWEQGREEQELCLRTAAGGVRSRRASGRPGFGAGHAGYLPKPKEWHEMASRVA